MQVLLEQQDAQIDLMSLQRPGEAAASSDRLVGVSACAHPVPIDHPPRGPSVCQGWLGSVRVVSSALRPKRKEEG